MSFFCGWFLNVFIYISHDDDDDEKWSDRIPFAQRCCSLLLLWFFCFTQYDFQSRHVHSTLNYWFVLKFCRFSTDMTCSTIYYDRGQKHGNRLKFCTCTQMWYVLDIATQIKGTKYNNKKSNNSNNKKRCRRHSHNHRNNHIHLMDDRLFSSSVVVVVVVVVHIIIIMLT